MGAPKGNEYYLLRSKHGRDTSYTPDDLLDKANEYFNWCLENPLYEVQIINRPFTKTTVKKGKEVKETVPYTTAQVPKMRAFSIQGFCNFAEIAINTFKSYEDKKDFVTVTTRIRGIIENQQFEGAASGFLNPNIIARKLGLADNQNTNVKNEQPLFPDE